MSRSVHVGVSLAVVLGIALAAAAGQPYPNPYRLVDGWAKFPDGRVVGAVV